MTEAREESGEGASAPEGQRPLFRPEAMVEPEFGETLAFPIPGWRSFAMLGAIAAVLFLGFGLLANFDRVATVRGIVVPAAGISRIAAPRSGIVTEILAEQGARIDEGAPLLRIASTNILPTGAADPDEVVATFRRQQEIARRAEEAEGARRVVERGQAAERAAELASTMRSLDEQIRLQRQRITSNERRLASLEPLREQGFVSEFTFRDQEERLLSLRQQLAAMEQQREEARHGLRSARLEDAALAADARRAELEGAGSRLALERGEAGAQAEAEVTVTAPVGGVLSALRAEIGTAVAAREPLAAITPADGKLEILLYVPPRSAGFLETGQEVVLRFDAFPYQRYGVGRGRIASIAEAASPEPAIGEEPVYRVRVTLTDGDFPLRPDMTLTAAITLERRSLFQWLFTPLRERMRQARQ